MKQLLTFLFSLFLLTITLAAQAQVGLSHSGCYTGNCNTMHAMYGTGQIGTNVTARATYWAFSYFTPTAAWVAVSLGPDSADWGYGCATPAGSCSPCNLCTVFVDVSQVFLSQAATHVLTGTFDYVWAIPNNPALQNVVVYSQMMLLDSSTSLWFLTNSWTFTIW